ncbi:MAG: hypothetical protein AAGF12_01935 [Myxococcota bacterium]
MTRANRNPGARLAALSVLVATVAAPSVADAQAWIRDPGGGYVQVSYRYLPSDSFFGADGNSVPSAEFEQHTVGLYGEIGVIERWLMFTLESEIFRRNVLVDQGAVTGLGDTRISAWTGLVEVPFRLSFGASLGIPTGDSRPDSDGGDILAQEVAAVLPTGDGEFDVTLQLAVGHGVRIGNALDIFGQGVLGYAIRTEGFTDQIVFRAETGVRPVAEGFNRFLLVFRVFGAELLGDAARTSGVAGLGDGVSYTAFGAELTGRVVDTFSLGFGVDSAFRATNISAGFNYKFSASYEF